MTDLTAKARNEQLKWEWDGGRLCRGKVSLTITEAYDAIPKNPDIAKACNGVLNPYKPCYLRSGTEIRT